MSIRQWFIKKPESQDVAPDGAAREQRIRALGPVLNLQFAQEMYRPLLENQRRDGVDVVRDIAYGPDARHRLDIYRPLRERAADAVMVFMPGGGFIRGDKIERENVGQYFARQGTAVVVANYRLAPAHVWPAGAEDVIAVYRWIRDNAEQYGLDAQRIILAGESAGAAHVAAATFIRRFHPAGGLSIAGAILISGVYNPVLEKLAREQFGVATPDPRNEAYYGSNFDSYQSMSTIALIDAPPSVPLLITYAELDMLQMQVQSCELFARLVTDHGCNPRLYVVRGHNHTTQTYAINTGDESLSAPMLEFLRAAAQAQTTARLGRATAMSRDDLGA
jgi:acetyl esterase